MTDELRQRLPRITNGKFLAYVRRQRCCACEAPTPSHAAHIRIANREIGKRECGMGEKPDDRYAVPLCTGCHIDDRDAQHKGSEQAFWTRIGKDPFKIAARLYGRFCRRHGGEPHPLEIVAGKRRRPIQKKNTKKVAFQKFNNSIDKSKPKRKWPKQSFPKGRTLRSSR